MCFKVEINLYHNVICPPFQCKIPTQTNCQYVIFIVPQKVRFTVINIIIQLSFYLMSRKTLIMIVMI